MKKLTVLRLIVDFLLIVSIPITLLTIYWTPYILKFDNAVNIINGIEITTEDFQSKLIFSSIVLSYLLLIYCIYLFRKILQSFNKFKLFSEYVLMTLNKIGIILIICSFLNGLPTLLYRIIYLKKTIVGLNLNTFIILFCSGLFFMILSEVFKIAQKEKLENELTI